MNPARKRIVFLCVENSCRSQMAEALARLEAGERYEFHSAGSRPSGTVNPAAIEVLAEMGYDLNTHRSKGLDDLPDVEFDVAVTMGCGDACPSLRARKRLDWQIPDPKRLPREAFRNLRDLIQGKVRELLAELSRRS